MNKVRIDKRRIVAFFLVLVLVMVTAVSCKIKNEKQDSKNDLEKVILTINDTDYTLQDIMYILYSVESQSADQIYTAKAFGLDESDYWNEIDDETGKTIRELTKDSVLDVAANIILQAQLAKEEGYELTEDELDTVNDEVQSVLKNLEDNPEYLSRTGFTEENLTEMVKQYDLAYKYASDKMAEIKIDEDVIREDISPDEYSQVEIEYILFWTMDLDQSGNYSYYEPEKVTEILEQAQAAYEEVAEGKDLLEVGDKYYSDEYTVEAGTQALYNNEEDNEESLYNAFKDLKVGELYPGVVETQEGYYILRLIDDNSTDAYNELLEQEIRQARESAYDEEFNKVKAGYTIQINEENWANIEIGNYAFPTLDFDSDEEFEYDEDNTEEDSDYLDELIIDDEGAVG